jgi:hypothetical protein
LSAQHCNIIFVNKYGETPHGSSFMKPIQSHNGVSNTRKYKTVRWHVPNKPKY